MAEIGITAEKRVWDLGLDERVTASFSYWRNGDIYVFSALNTKIWFVIWVVCNMG
jgi:hypothetical protein